MAAEPLLETIVTGGLCSGCGLCESLSGGRARMEMDDAGYLRPHLLQPLSAEQEHGVAATCPGLGLRHAPSQVPYHPLWGPMVQVRVGHALHPELRFAGSSGGAISGLLCYLLESRQVDYVLHIGASLSEPLMNEIKLSRTRGEVLAAAGSRYSPSAPLTGIDALLALPGRFAFVGKPCDVAGLRQYAKINPLVHDKVRYMLSFMCAGIPSIKGTEAILSRFGVRPDEVRRFAYRGNGWPGMTRVETHAGAVHETTYATSWGTILNRHLQPRCGICPDGVGEFADVVCADAWYGKNGYPDFAEKEGRSLIISRTASGEALLAEAMAAGYLTMEELLVRHIRQMQPYQEKRRQMVWSRVMKLRLRGRTAPRYRGLQLKRSALMGVLEAHRRNLLAAIQSLVLWRPRS